MRLSVLCVAAILSAWSEPVAAYPQFQLSLGADRCTACHFAPSGGGLLNAYGRDEAGGTISRGGDGRFLHGLWEPPAWLQLGADLRGVVGLKSRATQREVLAFPMQGDVYVRAGGERVAFHLTAGLRGGARDPQPPLVERLASREHYVMYERASGTYVRVGRFFPVHGIRTQDHTAYVRRYLGFHTLEEPYGVGGGASGEQWEAHVSAFIPRPVEVLGAGVKARGMTAYYERRFLDDTAALAMQTRIADSADDTRLSAGVVGKRWLDGAGVMVLAELDLVRQSFARAPGPTRYQLAGYLGASTFAIPGLMVGAAVQRWQPDLRLRSSRDAVQVDVQYFPRAHLELHLLLRASAEGDYDEPGLLSFLQLHYYL